MAPVNRAAPTTRLAKNLTNAPSPATINKALQKKANNSPASNRDSSKASSPANNKVNNKGKSLASNKDSNKVNSKVSSLASNKGNRANNRDSSKVNSKGKNLANNRGSKGNNKGSSPASNKVNNKDSSLANNRDNNKAKLPVNSPDKDRRREATSKAKGTRPKAMMLSRAPSLAESKSPMLKVVIARIQKGNPAPVSPDRMTKETLHPRAPISREIKPSNLPKDKNKSPIKNQARRVAATSNPIPKVNPKAIVPAAANKGVAKRPTNPAPATPARTPLPTKAPGSRKSLARVIRLVVKAAISRPRVRLASRAKARAMAVLPSPVNRPVAVNHPAEQANPAPATRPLRAAIKPQLLNLDPSATMPTRAPTKPTSSTAARRPTWPWKA